MKILAIVVIFFLSSMLFAGELVVGYGYIKPGCSVAYSGINACTRVATLTCNQKEVMVLSAPVCTGVPFVSIQRSDPAYIAARFATFYLDAPGLHNILSTVSIKSPNNVFEGRPLSSNYDAYSADGILDKPVILVEGYDPSNSRSPNALYQSGFNSIVTGGRDLFIVNLNSADKSIDESATLLQQIIQEINNAKGGNHPTAVIGYSMGGIVARKALKNMELAGINHQTSLYISYDAPHLGANAPLSLQETVDKIINEIDSKSFGYTPSSLKRARNIYNSRAAREMLIAGPAYQSVNSAAFPVNLARVAVTSGSMGGVLQSPSVTLNEQVANFRFYISDNKLFTWSITTSFISKLRGGAYYDNVPGGYLYQFDETLSELQAGASSFNLYQHSPNKAVAFVPTTSALAIAGAATTPARDRFKYYSPFDKFITVDQTGQSACSVYAAQNSLGSNQRHDFFDPNQMAQIKCALDEYHRVGFVIPDRSFKVN